MYGLSQGNKFQMDSIDSKYHLFQRRKRSMMEKMDSLYQFNFTHHASAVVIIVECFGRIPRTGCISVHVLGTQVCVKSFA